MRIATFNVNDVIKRFDTLVDWLAETQPDVACLQELKAEQGRFPVEPLRDLGYQALWLGQRSWNGVAILARGAAPIPTRTALPGDPADAQARYVEAAVGGVVIGCLYAPNGNPAPGPKFDYKLAWLQRLAAHAADLAATGAPVVLAGDYNIVPDLQDIYPTRSYDKDAVVQPQARAAFAGLLDEGWTDALRRVQPHGALWTYWSYLRGRWEADKGLRLDHLLLSPALAPRLRAAGVDRWVRGLLDASDHAPAWVDISD